MSDQGYLEAIKLIKKAVQDKAEKLDLSFKQLTHLPSEITQLKDCLRFLDLRNNKLSTLPPEIGELSGLTSLNCTDNEIQELPPEIGQLSCLQRLRLSYNKLEYLPPELGNLVNLTELYLSHNQLEFLPPEFGKVFKLERLSISNNNLQKLPREFGKLCHLIWLEIISNKLKNLPQNIGQLTRLHEIDLSYNQLIRLPLEIGNLSNLNKLNLQNNQLIDLPSEIGRLSNLNVLELSNNKLTKLPSEIGNLTKLEDLKLNYNSLTELPVEVYSLNNLLYLSLNNNDLTDISDEIIKLNKIRKISLNKNKLKRIPSAIFQLVRYGNLTYLDIQENQISIIPSIISLKNDPIKIVDFYEKYHLNRQRSTLKEAKILLVGQGTVGKTSLIRRLTYDKFNPEQQKTDGIDIQPWYPQLEDTNITSQIQDIDIKINIWDFGGQEIFHATHQFFLTERSLYLLVLDSRLDERDNQLEYWLQIIKSHGKDAPIIIVINKIDEHSLSLDNRGLENKYPNIKGFLKTSCKDPSIGIKELKEKMAQEVIKLSHFNEQFPEKWLEVKTKLEEKKEQDWDYISYEEYQEICQNQGITDHEEQKLLIRFLHDLGVVLNFQDDPRLKDTNILNPVWVTKGVYKILDDKDLEKRYKGILFPEMLDRILDNTKYPPSKHSFILDMMCKFELCFELNKEGEKQFLIADLLPKEEPENLKSWEEGLGFQYHYSVLPGNIISRFIVRINNLIYEENYWRNGVILKDEQNMALIKADRYANKILIWISGLEETRRVLLNKIRVQFQEIHQNISGIEVQEKVVMPNHPSICVDYQHLLNLQEMEIRNFVPVGLREKVSVKDLLEKFISESEKKQIEQQEKKTKNSLIQESFNPEKQDVSFSSPKTNQNLLVMNSWPLYLTISFITFILVIVISKGSNLLPFVIILLPLIIIIAMWNWVNKRKSNHVNKDS